MDFALTDEQRLIVDTTRVLSKMNSIHMNRMSSEPAGLRWT